MERIEDGGSLIIAWRIQGKRVLIIGGGVIASERIVSALIGGAKVIVISPTINDQVQSRVESKQVEWIPRAFNDADLEECDMVLTALDDIVESERIWRLCRAARIPVNVADKPTMCDFYFMSQHRDGPLQMAVSTNGHGPKMANMIRVELAKKLPPHMGEAILKMAAIRAKVRSWAPSEKQTMKRMRWVSSLCERWGLDNMACLSSLSSEEEEVLHDALLPHFQENTIPEFADIVPTRLLRTPSHKPSLVLVGAGPGDPELITLKAKRLIENADLVVSDRLVPPGLLELVQGELRIARKVSGQSDNAQTELMEWCLEGFQKGQSVVRLKIGDPFVFGRGGEEILWFRNHGIEAEVVPGISSALSGPIAAKIPITHRGCADQVLITTGRGTQGYMPELPPYHKKRTLIELMAVGRAGELRQMLLDLNYPPDCPACWIENANCPNERVVPATVDTLQSVVEVQGVSAPAVLVVGETVDLLQETH